MSVHRSIIADSALQTLEAATKASASLSRYGNEGGNLWLEMAEVSETPDSHSCLIATIGLSDFDLFWDDKKVLDPDGAAVRVEVFTIANKTDAEIARLAVSSLAFEHMSQHQFPICGRAVYNVVQPYVSASGLKHFYCTADYMFDDGLAGRLISNVNLQWLLLLPISDEEATYLEHFGDDALESAFEAADFDPFDLSRESVKFQFDA